MEHRIYLRWPEGGAKNPRNYLDAVVDPIAGVPG